MKRMLQSFLGIGLFVGINAYANVSIPLTIVSGENASHAAGTIVVSETKYGLLFTPELHGLTPGIHGFHVHEKPSCDKEGMAAGGHLDPRHTNKHDGPYEDNSHLGDLPAITVNADGTATLPVLAPRLKHLSAIKNHALMIHEGGDNYSDLPIKLGGGGGRMVCGVIK